MAWLGDLRGKRLSVAEAARRLGCSRGVVARARDNLRGKAPRGRPPVLSTAEERAIKANILHYHARGVPLTETDLCSAVQLYVNADISPQRRELVRQSFTDGRPGRDWMRCFRRRHPDVAKVSGKPLVGVRAAATSPENMARLLALIKLVREEKGIATRNVFNADECGVNAAELLASRRKRYLAPATGRPAEFVVLLL